MERVASKVLGNSNLFLSETATKNYNLCFLMFITINIKSLIYKFCNLSALTNIDVAEW